MRIGVTLPYQDRSGALQSAAAVAERAAWIEQAGLDGVWSGDHLPRPGFTSSDRPDMLTYLAIAAQATSRVELGTCVLIVPVRNPYDLAQRMMTNESFAPGRFTYGVGTGSQEKDYDAVGLAWGDRFARLADSMATIREMFDAPGLSQVPPGNPGATATPVEGPSWRNRVGMPRLVLGAWHSEPQLKRAVAEYDGWMGSAGPGLAPHERGGWRKVLSEAIARYRDLGGRRAIVSTVNVDLSVESRPLTDDDTFSLRCGVEEARERIGILDELGYDDVILWPSDSTSSLPFAPQRHDYTLERLQEIRTLLPADPRPYRDA